MSDSIDVNNNLCYTNSSTQIYLNSANADIYLNNNMKSNVTFFFEDPLTFDRHTMTKKFSVVNAVFPMSFYCINNRNNNIIINGGNYTFPNGNYNITQFINQWYITVGNSWILNYSSVTNKLSFNNTSLFSFSSSNNSIMQLLGFLPNTNYTSYGSGALFTLTPPYVVNLGGILKLDVKTSSFNFSNMDSYEKGRTNTICSIPINSNNNGYILYENFTNYNSMFRNQQISDLNIMIQDEFNNFIDFNNCDWSLTIQLDVLVRILDNNESLNDVYLNYAKHYIN